MIKYIFTRNDLIGSRLISGATKHKKQLGEETPSHFAILVDNTWCIHSNFANGVHIEPFYYFKRKNDTIRAFHKRDCKLSRIECRLLVDQIIEKAYGAKYDFLAIAFFTWRIFLRWAFNKPIPDKNKWEVKDKWFCNEILEFELGEDLSMKTPNDLMLMLETSDNFDAIGVFE